MRAIWIVRQCAWCEKFLDTRSWFLSIVRPDSKRTHGICNRCAERALRPKSNVFLLKAVWNWPEWDELKLIRDSAKSGEVFEAEAEQYRSTLATMDGLSVFLSRVRDVLGWRSHLWQLEILLAKPLRVRFTKLSLLQGLVRWIGRRKFSVVDRNAKNELPMTKTAY